MKVVQLCSLALSAEPAQAAGCMGSRQAHNSLHTEELLMDPNQIQRCADSASQSTGGQRLMALNRVPRASEPEDVI